MSRKIEVDTKTFVRFWMVVIALFLILLFISRALPALIVIGIAIFLAVAIKPLANRIDRIDKTKNRPGLSAGLSVIIVVAVIIFLISVIGPVIVNETTHFINQSPDALRESFSGISEGLNHFGRSVGITDLTEQIITSAKSFAQSIVGDISGFVVNSFSTIASILTNTILIIVLTIFFLLQGPPLMEGFWATVGGKNDKASAVAKRIVNRMANVISKYVSGQLTVALLDGTVVACFIAILSLIFHFSMGLTLPLGLIALLFMMIPMFGPIIGCVVISVLLAFSTPWAGLTFLISYIVYQQIESNVISPRIQGKGMNLPPLIILIAITIGMYMFGLIGAIVAIPIAGCIKVLIEEYPNIKALNE